jgi:HK97 family phage prohead protease
LTKGIETVEAIVIPTMLGLEYAYGGNARGRYVSAAFLEHIKAARAKMQCARCRQPISDRLPMTVHGSHCYHPDCAKRVTQQQTVRPTTTPSVIGRIIGVAVPFGCQCFVAPASGGDRSERFDRDAFSESIRRGGQQLTVDHHCGIVAGRLELFEEPQGLLFRHHVYDTPLGRQTIERMKQCRGCSIGFRSAADGEIADCYGTVVTRATLTEIALCFAAKPAWHSTCAQLEA